MNMYFIALVAPDKIDQQVLIWKKYFKDHYQCTVALKSPAHITLSPPFWMKEELETELIHSINEFSKTQRKLMINLKDFAAFSPRVIYVAVMQNPELNKLHHDLNDFICNENKFPIIKEDRVFHPHVTLATRDFYKKAFYEAWERFQSMEYQAAWMVNGISLLRHNKKNWDVIFTSQLDD